MTAIPMFAAYSSPKKEICSLYDITTSFQAAHRVAILTDGAGILCSTIDLHIHLCSHLCSARAGSSSFFISPVFKPLCNIGTSIRKTAIPLHISTFGLPEPFVTF